MMVYGVAWMHLNDCVLIEGSETVRFVAGKKVFELVLYPKSGG